jgi:hypothetical protein
MAQAHESSPPLVYHCPWCAYTDVLIKKVGHLSQDPSDQLGPYLARMRTEDIATAAAEAYGVVEPDETSGRSQQSTGERSCRRTC